MRFSELQKKEVIDATKGTFLGYVQDATVNVENGLLEVLHVSGEEKGMLFDFKKGELKKVHIEDIEIIGRDIVLVHLK